MIKYLLIPICSFLWAWAGSEGSSYRKVGIPIVSSMLLWNLWSLLLFIPFMLGYGIPCWNDEGSLIGRFIYNLVKVDDEVRKQHISSILMAITKGIIYGSFIGFIISSYVPVILLGTLIPLVEQFMPKRQIKVFGKGLNLIEFIIGGLVGAGLCL